MLDTSVRLLRLLSLLQVWRDWSGADLAGRLDVTTRTVRNDIERLRILGYEVHSSTGITGGYRLGAGSAMPPLLLDDDEAVAVGVGLRAAASGSVIGIEETPLRALAKLERTLPARLRHRPRLCSCAAEPATSSRRCICWNAGRIVGICWARAAAVPPRTAWVLARRLLSYSGP
jgi:predicted DNA-binding transcriptional regulator YafY